MNPSTSFPAGIYTPPFGTIRRSKSKPTKGASSSKPYRSQSTNENRLYRQILDWKRADARTISRRSQAISTNPNDLIKQIRSLTIKASESAKDCRTQEREKTPKKRTRFVITDLSSNNLARHDEKFFRPLTGREKQRRISVWVQNVEHQRLAAPDSTEAVTCDTPSTETTGRLSASLVSQHGSSAATPTQHHQHQHQRTAPAHRHQHHHGPGPAKRPHV